MNLSDLPEIPTEAEFAEWLGVSLRTVHRKRATRTGPDFIKIGGKVFYRRAAIEKWLLAKEQVQPRAKVREAA